MDFKHYFDEPNLRDSIERYSASHSTPINQALHFVGIPLLAVALLGLLSEIQVTTFEGPAWLQPNLALAAVVGIGIWYCRKNMVVGLVLVGVGGVCYLVASLLPWIWLAAMGVAGAVCHWIGHYAFEGKQASFVSRPISVLEAPIWLIARWTGYEPQPKSDA